MSATLPTVQTVLNRGYARIPKNARVAFASAFVMGFIVHLYMFTNKFPNHDELLLAFENTDLATAGRWFLGVLCWFGSSFSLPWINGLIAITALSISAALIVTLLRLESPLQAFLAAFALVSFPAVGNTFAFMFTSDGYFLGLMLAVLGVFVLFRYRLGFLPAAALFTLSLGTYQAYICFAIALIAMRALALLITGEKSDREILLLATKCIVALALAAALYALIAKGALLIMGREMDRYLGNHLMSGFRISALPRRILAAYYEFFYFLFVQSGRFSGLWLSIAHLLTGCAAAFGLIRLLIKHRPRTRLQTALAIALLALLPLWMNAIYLTNAPFFSNIMIYSIAGLYLVALMTWSLSDRLLPKRAPDEARALKARFVNALIGWVAAVTVLFSSLCWTVYTNQGYFILQTKYENMYALGLRIVDRIESSPDYRVDMPVAILGTPENNYPSTKKAEYKGLDFAVGFGSEYDYEYFRSDLHIKEFMRVYLGVSYAHMERSKILHLKDTETFIQMPSYPYAGSVTLIDDTLVVKLGDDNYYGWEQGDEPVT